VTSGCGIFEGSIPECFWGDRDKQRKPSIAVVAVPARLRPGRLTNAHHIISATAWSSLLGFLHQFKSKSHYVAHNSCLYPCRNLQLDILRFIQVYSTSHL